MAHKQLKRPQRLQDAKAWLATYQGKKVFSAYRKRYGVDWLTTFRELEMLGIAIEPAYKEQVLRVAQREAERKKQKQQDRLIESIDPGFDQDDTFAFIVGYTSGGAPYGITWEEWNDQNPEPD